MDGEYLIALTARYRDTISDRFRYEAPECNYFWHIYSRSTGSIWEERDRLCAGSDRFTRNLCRIRKNAAVLNIWDPSTETFRISVLDLTKL